MANTDAQSVWKELSEHMRTSSKGASEKRRLPQYVTNTVLDDNFIGTTEQLVLHFNEQFWQLEEISEAHYYQNIRALRTLHIVRKTLCRSH